MLSRLILRGFWAGLLAGLFWGICITQAVYPLIEKAESYETSAAKVPLHGEKGHDHSIHHGQQAAAGHGGHGHSHGDSGLSRHLYTIVATAGLGIAFGILFAVAVFFLSYSSLKLSGSTPALILRGGFLGLLGFAALHGLPSIGLPPPPPGVVGADADYAVRQAWWFGTTFAAILAYFAAAFLPGLFRKQFKLSPVVSRVAGLAAAVLIIAAPFLIGVPEHVTESKVPETLKTMFTLTTLGVNALFWVVLGAIFLFLAGKDDYDYNADKAEPQAAA